MKSRDLMSVSGGVTNHLGFRSAKGAEMSSDYYCTVSFAGPAAQNSGETPSPVIYIRLTDEKGDFPATWFFAANECKNEMLATALAAISTQSLVYVWADPPLPLLPGPWQIYNLYIVA